MGGSVSVVVPVFDGGPFIARSLTCIHDVLSTLGVDAELVVVNDGSSDDTREAVESVRSRLPRLLYLENQENRGKGFSVRRALGAASGEQLVFIDADLAYPPENIAVVLDALGRGADLAIACRMHEDSRYVMAPERLRRVYTRHAAGRLFNAVTRAFVVGSLRDTQAGLKGFRRDALRRLLPLLTLDRFSFDVEVLFLARRLGLRISEVPVTFVYSHEPSSLELGRDGARMLADLVRIRWRALSGRYDEE